MEGIKGGRRRQVCPHAGRRGGGGKFSKGMFVCVCFRETDIPAYIPQYPISAPHKAMLQM
jgi:hypothetical protein